MKGGEPICHPSWIVESLEANTLLDFRKFLLYSAESKSQPKLNFKPVPPSKDLVVVPPASVTDVETSVEGRTPSSSAGPGPGSVSALDANDSRFLGEFYSNSRLHHISTMGADFKRYVAELRERSDGFFPGRSALSVWKAAREDVGERGKGGFRPLARQLIMHIDMDCFFVSVGLRK